ncbi:hypothetical protein BDZ89DRAFT_531792 [Hymenopellis radicata]|nr:hypothetical protein BDZ89DRAFT_531792 [Hymenopellis radicata]
MRFAELRVTQIRDPENNIQYQFEAVSGACGMIMRVTRASSVREYDLTSAAFVGMDSVVLKDVWNVSDCKGAKSRNVEVFSRLNGCATRKHHTGLADRLKISRVGSHRQRGAYVFGTTCSTSISPLAWLYTSLQTKISSSGVWDYYTGFLTCKR